MISRLMTARKMICMMIGMMMMPWVSGQVVRVDTDGQMMNREPFILESGELYRDVLTITTSQLAAVFARNLEAKTRPGAGRRKDKMSLRRRQTPPIFPDSSHMPRKGRMMPDEEIFDFTDSRFLQPPQENMKNFPEVNLVNLGGQTFVTPAPMDRESPVSPSHPMSAPETVSHPPHPPPPPSRQFRPTPQPIFHVTMQTVMDHVSKLPKSRHVSTLPDIGHVSTLSDIGHVSRPALDTRHVSSLPHVTEKPRVSIFGTIKPFVNLGSGPHQSPGHHSSHRDLSQADGHILAPLRPHPGPVRTLRSHRRHRNQGLGYRHAWHSGYR